MVTYAGSDNIIVMDLEHKILQTRIKIIPLILIFCEMF